MSTSIGTLSSPDFFTDLIEATIAHRCLGDSAVQALVKGLMDGSVSDRQLAAWLMAVRICGLHEADVVALTSAMANRHFDDVPFEMLDKHSTGGVGDKTTLVVVPIVAAAGCLVGKMSGGRLGFAGGTLDKLGVIPGLRLRLDRAEFLRTVSEIGMVLAGQSETLAAADARMYALRHETGSVESLPLIASSVMSKKLAGGARGLVLDVKFGTGAFMSDLERARTLASLMVRIGHDNGVRTTALLTSMDRPIGRAVGGTMELAEALSLLAGETVPRLSPLCEELAIEMLLLGRPGWGQDEARAAVNQAILSGAAMQKFRTWVEYQGGSVEWIDRLVDNFGKRIATTRHGDDRVLRAECSGRVCAVDPRTVGVLDHRLFDVCATEAEVTGIHLGVQVGDIVNSGDILATLYGAGGVNDIAYLRKAFRIVHDGADGTAEIDAAHVVADVIRSPT